MLAYSVVLVKGEGGEKGALADYKKTEDLCVGSIHLARNKKGRAVGQKFLGEDPQKKKKKERRRQGGGRG